MTERKIGLVIGTNNYKDPGMKLNFAEEDARAIKEILSDPNLCEFDEVIELIDKPCDEVSRKIENTLKKADQNDTILIYFSGHGEFDDIISELHLLFKDTEREYLLSTSLAFDFINRCIKHSKCKKIIMVLDSCYSGAAGLKGGDDLITNTIEAASGAGKIILSASKGRERAKEDKDLKHGVFTNYLLEGLKGEADTNNDGRISIDALYTYASKKTKERNPHQTPIKKGEFEGDIFIGKNPKKIKENIFNEKIIKLISKTQMGLSVENYRLSYDILLKVYINSLPLTDEEEKIKPFLDGLLDDTIPVKLYNETILKIHPKEKAEEVVNKKLIEKEIDELNTFAQQLYDEWKYREAIDTWEKVLNLNSENQTAKEGIKKAEEKLKVEEKISELSSQAQKLFVEKRYAEAIAKWQEVLELEPESRKAIKGIEETDRILGELEEKKRKIDKLNTSAQQLYDKGKYVEALDTWQKVLVLDSENKTAKDGSEKAKEEIKKRWQAQKPLEEKRYAEKEERFKNLISSVARGIRFWEKRYEVEFDKEFDIIIHYKKGLLKPPPVVIFDLVFGKRIGLEEVDKFKNKVEKIMPQLRDRTESRGLYKKGKEYDVKVAYLAIDNTPGNEATDKIEQLKNESFPIDIFLVKDDISHRIENIFHKAFRGT